MGQHMPSGHDGQSNHSTTSGYVDRGILCRPVGRGDILSPDMHVDVGAVL
jgi:hypothetical protein